MRDVSFTKLSTLLHPRFRTEPKCKQTAVSFVSSSSLGTEIKPLFRVISLEERGVICDNETKSNFTLSNRNNGHIDIVFFKQFNVCT